MNELVPSHQVRTYFRSNKKENVFRIAVRGEVFSNGWLHCNQGSVGHNGHRTENVECVMPATFSSQAERAMVMRERETRKSCTNQYSKQVEKMDAGRHNNI
jgi:hypothetical protein